MDPIILLFVGVVLFLVVLIGLGLLFFLRRQQPATKQKTEEASPTKNAGKTTSQAVETNNNKAQPQTNSNQATATTNSVSPPIKSALTDQPLDTSSDDKIRILLVDDNLGTRDNVSRLLYFEKDMEVIGQAVNGREGVELAVELKPHIVLMDINMPDMDGITATREMAVQAPYSQVIIMSVQADQHYMKRAMAAGARDFQPKPFTSEELVNCIRRVYKVGIPAYQQFEVMEETKTKKNQQPAAAGDSSTPRMAHTPVVVVYSPKGGVGTSAIAANLAIALHQNHGGVVLLDGDLQFGDISVHLNTRPERTISDLVHDGNLEIDLVQDILIAHNSGVKILLAPPQPQLADMIRPEMMKNIITSLKNDFKMVVVDTHNHLEELTLSILEMADYILLVLTPELPAIKSSKLFLELAEQLEFPIDRIKIVVNRANMPGGINLTKLEKVLNVDKSYRIPYDSKLHFALNNRGLSIYQQDPGAPSARALADLTQELLAAMPVSDDKLEKVP
ncbi:MAG: response regulator [Anaerolineae bacterium]|nr:response regulator [Anaerolineae bacterium]